MAQNIEYLWEQFVSAKSEIWNTLQWLLRFALSIFVKPYKPSPLEQLPLELLLLITEHLPPRSLDAFLRTNRHFAQLLTPSFYNLAIEQEKKYCSDQPHKWIPMLSLAVSMGNYPLAKFLLGKGVDVNIEDKGMNKEIPIHYAARAHHHDPRVLELLIENGADIERRDWDLRTPLHYATRESAMILLAKGAKTEVYDKDGNTPLHLAVISYRTGAILVLLGNGASVESRNPETGYTALDEALDWKTRAPPTLIKALLSSGAKVEGPPFNQSIPLQKVLRWNPPDISVIRVLLDCGARVSERNSLGQTALHILSRGGRKISIAAARLLLSRAEEGTINAESYLDRHLTILDIATAHGRMQNDEDLEFVHLLVESGARGGRSRTETSRCQERWL